MVKQLYPNKDVKNKQKIIMLYTLSLYSAICQLYLNKTGRRGGFPGGAGVKNPHANAGDTGSSPGPGRSHMLRSD